MERRWRGDKETGRRSHLLDIGCNHSNAELYKTVSTHTYSTMGVVMVFISLSLCLSVSSVSVSLCLCLFVSSLCSRLHPI